VLKAKRFIRKHYAERVTVEDIGRHASVAPDYLNRIFRAETGRSLHQYLNDLRIGMARNMMADGVTNITEIAFATGFQDSAYFATRFRKAMGCSPREYLRHLTERD
jgi:AraC-like DNA-binding protein